LTLPAKPAKKIINFKDSQFFAAPSLSMSLIIPFDKNSYTYTIFLYFHLYGL